NACRAIGNFLRRGRLRIPVSQEFDFSSRYRPAILISQQVFEKDAHAIRQALKIEAALFQASKFEDSISAITHYQRCPASKCVHAFIKFLATIFGKWRSRNAKRRGRKGRRAKRK